MEQGPSGEANQFSGNLEFHALIGTIRLITAFTIGCQLNQLDPVLTPSSIFLKRHLNIILPSSPGSS